MIVKVNFNLGQEFEVNKITPISKKKTIQRITFDYGNGHTTKVRTVAKYNPNLPPPNFPRIQDVFSSSHHHRVWKSSLQDQVMTRSLATAQSTPNPRKTILGPYKDIRKKDMRHVTCPSRISELG